MDKNYCYWCMEPLPDETMVACPHCGKPIYPTVPSHHLRPGTILQDEFLVGCALGEGGFGITYIGRDLTLDIPVAIKEYYPNGYSNRNNELTNNVTITRNDGDDYYKTGKKRFLEEARVLARFDREPGVVTVRRFFEANNTAYIVMEYLRGVDMKHYVKEHGKLSAQQLLPMLKPVMRALEKIHEAGVIHRDISPDNLMLMEDGTLKLLDFGAARQIDEKKSLSVVLKHGYAPIEQYRSHGGQGPWTDVYALCATMYYCLTGTKPPESVQRAMDGEDSLKAPSALGAAIKPLQEAALMRGLAVRKDERYQSMKELMDGLFKSEIVINPPPPPPPPRKKRLLAVLLAAVALIGAIIALVAANSKLTIGTHSYDKSTTFLSLSGQQLTENDIKAVQKLKKLKTLIIQDCTLPNMSDYGLPESIKNLKIIDVDTFYLSNKLTGLEQLELSGINHLTGLTYLSGCEKLNILTIRDCDIGSYGIDYISKVGTLRELTLESLRNHADFTGIGAMTQLKKLSLSGNELADTSFIESLSSLENLYLDSCGLSNLSFVPSLEKIRYLSVDDNALSSLDGLESALYLTNLHASGNGISSIEALSNSTRLETVDLSGNMIEDASVLVKSAEHLKKLYLDSNMLDADSLAFLPQAAQLETLCLDYNYIYGLSLSGLDKLKKLSVRGCKLETLEIGNSQALEYIDASFNSLYRLDLPETMAQLRYLRLSFNDFREFVIPDTSKALTLILSANPLNKLSFTDANEELSYLILDCVPSELFEVQGEYDFSEIIAQLKIKKLALEYPKSGLNAESLKSWSADSYYIRAVPMDKLVDMQEALGSYRLKTVDSLYDITMEAYNAQAEQGHSDFWTQSAYDMNIEIVEDYLNSRGNQSGSVDAVNSNQ